MKYISDKIMMKNNMTILLWNQQIYISRMTFIRLKLNIRLVKVSLIRSRQSLLICRKLKDIFLNISNMLAYVNNYIFVVNLCAIGKKKGKKK